MSPTCTTKARSSRLTRASIATNASSSRSLYCVSPITPKEKASGWVGGIEAQPQSASASSAAARLVIREVLQPVERGERFLGAQLVGLQSGERRAQLVPACFLRRRGEEVGLRTARAKLLLQFCEMAARRAHHVL